MRLTPYARVDDVDFEISPEELVARRGRPCHVDRNDAGLIEYDYDDEVYRFQDGGRLEEVTKQVRVLHLDGVAVPLPALEGFVDGHDEAAFRRAGFLVSPRFGLAFVPDGSRWVTALAEHCIDTWRAL